MNSGSPPPPTRSNPNDPKNPVNIAAGGTPSQLATQAAATAVQAKQDAAVQDATAQQQAAITLQKQRASLYSGLGATTLTGGIPLGNNYQGKNLLGM